MRIGIKFCGGCNSTYQRGECVERLKQKFPEHTYVPAGEEKNGDLLLVVCGCAAGCAAREMKAASFTDRLVLTRMKDFVEAERYLEKKRKPELGEQEKTDILQKRERKLLSIGEKASMRRTFYREETDRFAVLTGDKNRLHIDADFAGEQWFGKQVVHGVLAASLMSSVMGSILPGDGTILMEEQIAYEAPVYFGDTIEASVWFLSCREAKKCYIGTFYGECRNQRGEITARGTFRQMMMKSLFEVTKEENGTQQERKAGQAI